MKGKMPPIGQQVSTTLGKASVVGVNPLKETVIVQLESQATVELAVSDITVTPKATTKKRKQKEEPKS
jgi:hypothetical protein